MTISTSTPKASGGPSTSITRPVAIEITGTLRVTSGFTTPVTFSSEVAVKGSAVITATRGDGWTVARRGHVVGFVGSNLMKFGPLLGELLAAAVLSDGLPSDLNLTEP